MLFSSFDYGDKVGTYNSSKVRNNHVREEESPNLEGKNMDVAGASFSKGTMELWIDLVFLALFFGSPLK
jgi:hypothetical protein